MFSIFLKFWLLLFHKCSSIAQRLHLSHLASDTDSLISFIKKMYWNIPGLVWSCTFRPPLQHRGKSCSTYLVWQCVVHFDSVTWVPFSNLKVLDVQCLASCNTLLTYLHKYNIFVFLTCVCLWDWKVKRFLKWNTIQCRSNFFLALSFSSQQSLHSTQVFTVQ